MMFLEDKIRDLKWSLVFICIAMTAILFGLVFVQAKYGRAMTLKNLQVNSLIDEVGMLQEENFSLSIELEKENEQQNNLQEKFLNLSNYLGVLEQTKAGLFETREDLAKVSEYLELARQEMGKQDLEIATVAEFNQELLTRLHAATVDYPDTILNILILGTHGTLTDTIMLASVNPELRTMTLISVPRDLYVNGRKINEFYTRFGVEKLKEVLGKITGLSVDKYVVVNLDSFVEAVDVLGGLTIEVAANLYDTQYPGANDSYTIFLVEKGIHKMDGEMALKYARSRKSTSDFDRAKRQQQVLEAFRDKVLALNLVNDVNKAVKLAKDILLHMDSDIDVFEVLSWLDKYRNFQFERNNVLSTQNFLYSTFNQRGQYILLPNDSTYAAVKEYIGELVLE